MNCSDCNVELTEENKVNKRKLCKECYNKRKREYKNSNLPERQGVCKRCNKETTLLKGRYECRECKNDRASEARAKMTEEDKQRKNEKARASYAEKTKENQTAKIVTKITEKECTVCNKTLNINEFFMHKGKGTYRSECKSCAATKRIENYHKNKPVKVVKKIEPKKPVNPTLKKQKEIECKMYESIFRENRTRGRKSKLLIYLGCESFLFIRGWLEAKFQSDMSWDNHKTVWEIEHIEPESSFDFSKEDNIGKYWHYKNLRPRLIKNE